MLTQYRKGLRLRVAVMGCVEVSDTVLGSIADDSRAELVGVVTRKKSNFNADFCSLIPAAERLKIPWYIAERNRQVEMARWLRELEPDVVFCVGWSYLLGPELLEIPALGFVGYHPAPLPLCRGRHPLIWSLILGLTGSASTLFLMDEGADTGDILSQEKVPILEQDNARALYDRLAATVCRQVGEVLEQMVAGTLQPVAQDHGLATWWRKRSAADGLIDWRMSAYSIHNLVRALSEPYPGADCLVEGILQKVWKTSLIEMEVGEELSEPGKVLRVVDGCPVIRCGEGCLAILEHELGTLPARGYYFEPQLVAV